MVLIKQADAKDLLDVSILEMQIEKENAASFETLKKRFKVFPGGFRILQSGNKILGYLESCRWDLDLENLEHFGQISDFPKHHKDSGKNLYIIFVAVDENYRRNGIGSALVENISGYSMKKGLGEMQLVAGEGLIPFYEKLGFRFDRVLPQFLPYSTGALMRKKISQRSENGK